MPSRAVLLPTNHHRAHAVGDEVACALLHLHHQAVFLPPARDNPRSRTHPALFSTISSLLRKNNVRRYGCDTSSHLIHTRRKQVRDGRHFAALHIGQRNLSSTVIDRLDKPHLGMQGSVERDSLLVERQDFFD